jgi:hypothetical protein
LHAADRGHSAEDGVGAVGAAHVALFHVAFAFDGEFALGVGDALAVQHSSLITPKFRLNEIKLFSQKARAATLARICEFPSKSALFLSLNKFL